jgi:hypothetical protein
MFCGIHPSTTAPNYDSKLVMSHQASTMVKLVKTVNVYDVLSSFLLFRRCKDVGFASRGLTLLNTTRLADHGSGHEGDRLQYMEFCTQGSLQLERASVIKAKLILGLHHCYYGSMIAYIYKFEPTLSNAQKIKIRARAPSRQT